MGNYCESCETTDENKNYIRTADDYELCEECSKGLAAEEADTPQADQHPRPLMAIKYKWHCPECGHEMVTAEPPPDMCNKCEYLIGQSEVHVSEVYVDDTELRKAKDRIKELEGERTKFILVLDDTRHGYRLAEWEIARLQAKNGRLREAVKKNITHIEEAERLLRLHGTGTEYDKPLIPGQASDAAYCLFTWVIPDLTAALDAGKPGDPVDVVQPTGKTGICMCVRPDEQEPAWVLRQRQREAAENPLKAEMIEQPKGEEVE